MNDVNESHAGIERLLEGLAARDLADAPQGLVDRVTTATWPDLLAAGAPVARIGPATMGPGWISPARMAAALALVAGVLAVIVARSGGAGAGAEAAARIDAAADWQLVSSLADDSAGEIRTLLSEATRLSSRLSDSTDWAMDEGSM